MAVDATGLKEPLVITVANKDKTIADENDNFSANINPQSYDLNSSVSFNKLSGMGRVGKNPRFCRVNEERFGFDIVLDGSGVVGAVGAEVTSVKDQLDKLHSVIGYDGNNHEPKYSRVSWGKLIFWGRYEKLKVQYTLFKPDGSVLRAKVRIDFISFVKDDEESLQTNKSSPDLSHIIEIKAGDTLVHLCDKVYDDPSYYLDIARINKLTNFRHLSPGQKLIFPPLG